jgi:hypothetical protein
MAVVSGYVAQLKADEYVEDLEDKIKLTNQVTTSYGQRVPIPYGQQGVQS